MYETPSFDQYNRSYRVVLTHKTAGPSGDVVCQLMFGDIPEDTTDRVMQDFVDLVAASENFAISSAQKSRPSVQTISPTS